MAPHACALGQGLFPETKMKMLPVGWFASTNLFASSSGTNIKTHEDSFACGVHLWPPPRFSQNVPTDALKHFVVVISLVKFGVSKSSHHLRLQ